RAQVLAHRWHRHQLDGAPGGGVDLLDFGVQDTGPDGAAWALHVRGGPAPADADHVLAWTLRGAPHLYRRADIAAVAVATAPLSEADAASRIYDAHKPLRAAGIAALDALRTVAAAARRVVTAGMPKGTVSAAVAAALPDPYLRHCRPCQATHVWEQVFRLPMLQAGLALTPGTSPPVLRRIPGLRPCPYARAGDAAAPRWHVVRNYLRFYGPATAREVAAYLDAPVREVQRCWPRDAVPVAVRDDPRTGLSALAADVEALADPPRPAARLRMLGPYDPYLQGRDRALIVPDPDRRTAMWPVLGRPGVVVVDGEVAGIWRPRRVGRRLAVTARWWRPADAPLRKALDAEAQRLAAFRCVPLRGVDAD
ncbi:MAG TPA: crosslink repair DNA glycosylase YcaQ family protein, partial [Pilimelia sp.]|nr:crosslink repair DNA glycosylase YcaQ family protein [Pilimelia sp.]